MHVILPVSSDPRDPRPGGVMSYSLGLARFLLRTGTSVEFLCTGVDGEDQGAKMTAVAGAVSGELPFARALARHARFHRFPSDSVVAANSELYAWALGRSGQSLPIVLIAHGPKAPTLRRSRPVMGRAFQLLIEPRALRLSRFVVAIDRESQEYFAVRYPQDRIHRIPLGIDVEHFRPIDRTAARTRWSVTGHPVVLFVGRLAPEKRPLLAIEAYHHIRAKVPDSVLLIAGTGRLQREVETRGAKEGRDRVRSLGVVPRVGLPSLYSTADVVLMTSDFEQFPNVVLESLACGTPVVSTPVGDVREILDEPQLGAVAGRSEVELARSLLTTFPESDEERVARQGVRVKRAESFSWNRVGPQIASVLHAALETGSNQ